MRNEVKVGALPNGIRFYSQHDWSHATNLAGIGLKVGSIHAPSGCVGLPHLVEHLLARESLAYSSEEADLIFEKFLGDPDDDINIRIDRVSTHYGFGDLPRKKDMLTCLDVMASFLNDRILTSAGIDIEKSAIHNEYHERGRDVMTELLDDLIHHLMYERNPARLRIDCEVEDLRKVGRSRIERFIKSRYISENVFLVVLGPKFEEVKDLASRYLGDWPRQPKPRLDYDNSDDLPVLMQIKTSEVTRDIGQHHVAVGFPTESYMSKDAEVLAVLARILALRLRRRLRDGNRRFDQGVYRANVDISKSFLHGLIYAHFASVSGEFAKRGEEIVLEEFRGLQEELVSERELDAMIYRIDVGIYSDPFHRKIGELLAEMIIEAVCNGDDDLSHLHSFRGRLHRVTRKKIREVANKYFVLPNYASVVISPA